MLSLNRLKSSVYAVNNLYGLIKSRDVSRYRLYSSISKAFSSSAPIVLTSPTDKKLKRKSKAKKPTDKRTETKPIVPIVPIILSKPHLVASNDTSDFIIKNEDDLITFSLNYLIRDEICDITRVMRNITNGEMKQLIRVLYKNSSDNTERYAYKVVVDAILSTVQGKTLFPLKVPKVVVLESKKKLYDALIMCVKKTASCSEDQWKIKEDQVEAVAYTITTLLPTNTCNTLTSLFVEYANGNVTKTFFVRQLFFFRKNHTCELDSNIYHVVQSVLKFFDIVVDSDDLWKDEHLKYKKKDCKKDFLSSLSAFLGDAINSKKTSISDIKELRNTVTERMNSNKIKELIVDLQTIREAIPSEKQLVAGEILLKRGASQAASLSSAIHITILRSIKNHGCVEFPLYINIPNSEKSDIDISKSMARLLVSIKTMQTKQSSSKDEETLGLVIDNYVNKIDHKKLAATLSKTICSHEKTSRECHNLLQEFVSRSCTALKLKEDLGILYTDNHAIYDEINSYLGLDHYNDNDSASLQLEPSTNVFDQFMLFNELQYFVSKQAHWNQQYKVDAEFFSKANRAGNMRSFLDNMPKEKKKKLGHQLLYSTIMCASIKDGTTHIQLNDENNQVLPSLSASESISLKIPKVFIDNLPSNVDEKIVKNAFKRCGSVAKVWVYKAPDDDDHVPHESTKVINDGIPFKKYSDDDTSDDEDNDRDYDISGTKKKKIKLKVVKRKVKRPLRADSYAFVEMTDGEGFLKATRDENRIFGLCINSNSCRIQDSTKMRTLFVEFAVLLTTNEVKKMLKDIIGGNFELYCEDVNSEHNNSTSLFIHLEFVNHEEAWAAFQLIQKKTKGGAPIRAHWQKNKFWNLAREELFRYFSKTGDDAKIEELPKINDKVNEI